MLKSEVMKLLKSSGIDVTEDKLEMPPQDGFGDISFPCFQLSKTKKMPPNEIASELKDKIKVSKSPMIKEVETVSGYVNFFFDWKKVGEKLLREILTKSNDYGKINLGKNKVAVVDYSSPNPIHPIHVGSARSTLIGEALCRMLEFSGYDVKRVLFINNLGKQVAVLLWYYLKFASDSKPDKKEDHWLLDMYVKADKEFKAKPDYENEVFDILKKSETKGEKVFPKLKHVIEWCLKGFEKTYDTLGIKFDDYIWESDFVEKSKLYVSSLLKNNLTFKTSDEAVVIDLEPHGLPNTIIMRRDGTTLYLIRDVAASIYKIEKYKPSLNIYVVAEDQSLHFKQEFKILELLGHKKFVENSRHLSYGYVSLPEGKMSSRLGRVVLLDDLIDEAVEKVKEKFKVNDNEVAKSIGLGAVTYSILKVEAKRQVLFKWEDVLSMEGNSGPYLQYAYARCCSILKKADLGDKKYSIKKLDEHEEKLLKELVSFEYVIKQSVKELRPDILCNYVFDLATRFNTFYHFCPVLNAENEKIKNFRLSLVESVKIVLGSILDLLNIEKLEKV